MEVRASEWKQKAIDNITQYVHRGGENQGDVPQLIGGCDLLNTIGWAMGLPTSDPEQWTASELERALQGRLVFYAGQAREAIDVIANQIRACCGGDDRNYVTVLPLELYFNGKLFELPLFRVKRTAKSKNYYVDNVGRSYDSPDDWNEHNKFPPGEVAYPIGMRLALGSGGQRARVSFADTPSARLGSQVASGVDVVSAVAGLSASVALLFVSGGLAAPLVVTSASAAVWGTGRAGYHLADRASHGESVNPFGDAQSRMLWLGIAANLASFGAMGATMRLTSLAARGRDISTAMRVLTNVANGTNVAVSGLAIVNSTIYMIEHHQDMSAVDVLMQGASIAFWTKGVFTYRTSNMIIRDAQNYAFVTITSEMSPEEASQFETVRNRIGNDAQLLQKFRLAMNSNISPREYSQLLVDGMQYYDTVTTLSPEQISAFDGLRGFLRDDVRLISGLRRVADGLQLSPREALERVLHMWQRMAAAPAGEGRVVLRGGSLVLGRAPPVRIDQLGQLSAPMIRFLGEHLSRVDVATGGQWATAVPVLLELQGHGMFTTCPVARVVSGGRAVLSLNGHLDVSIYRLQAIGAEDRVRLFGLLSSLPAGAGSAQLPPELRQCVREQRLRLECQRREAVGGAREHARGRPALLRLLDGELRSHERDRLYTWADELKMYKADAYVTDMMAFVADMQPASVSEMVAYSEFVMTYVEDQALILREQIRNGELPMPDVRVAVWTRQTAAAAAFRDTRALRQRFAQLAALVRDNAMVGRAAVPAGLSDARLLAALRDARVAFGSVASAAYHVAKHPTQPPAAYVARANATLRNPAARALVALGQDGDVRTLTVEDDAGRCLLLERDGSVILCSFMPR